MIAGTIAGPRATLAVPQTGVTTAGTQLTCWNPSNNPSAGALLMGAAQGSNYARVEGDPGVVPDPNNRQWLLNAPGRHHGDRHSDQRKYPRLPCFTTTKRKGPNPP